MFVNIYGPRGFTYIAHTHKIIEISFFRYLVDIIVMYEEDGQVASPDFDDGGGGGGGIQLQSYSQGRKQAGSGCCGGTNEPNSTGVR